MSLSSIAPLCSYRLGAHGVGGNAVDKSRKEQSTSLILAGRGQGAGGEPELDFAGRGQEAVVLAPGRGDAVRPTSSRFEGGTAVALKETGSDFLTRVGEDLCSPDDPLCLREKQVFPCLSGCAPPKSFCLPLIFDEVAQFT